MMNAAQMHALITGLGYEAAAEYLEDRLYHGEVPDPDDPGYDYDTGVRDTLVSMAGCLRDMAANARRRSGQDTVWVVDSDDPIEPVQVPFATRDEAMRAAEVTRHDSAHGDRDGNGPCPVMAWEKLTHQAFGEQRVQWVLTEDGESVDLAVVPARMATTAECDAPCTAIPLEEA